MTMDKCAKCQRSIRGNELVVQCIGCRMKKHVECAKVNPGEAHKKRWRCKNCKNDNVSNLTALKRTPAQEPKVRLQSSQERERKMMKTEKKEMKSLQRLEADDLDKLKVQCYDGHVKLKSLERRTKALIDKYEDVRNKNLKLENELSTYKLKVEDLEQKIRENAVEIWGISVSKKDNLMDILEGVCDAIDWKLSKHQVERIWKVEKPENEFVVGTLIGRMDASVPRTVVCVNFATCHYKDEFMRAWKSIEQAGGVTLKQLGINSEGRIKIENSLTPYKQQLFQKALEYANDFHYPRVGVKDGEIYMLKDLTSGPLIFIKTPKDLEKMADIDRRL